jgi:hypothetical protein
MRGSPGFGELSVAKEAKLDAIALNALGWSGGGEFIDEALDHEGVVGHPDARHKAANGSARRGNAHFAWFGPTGSKSRLNFLALLRAGYDDYVINAAALAYMRERALATHVMARLIAHPARCTAHTISSAVLGCPAPDTAEPSGRQIRCGAIHRLLGR